MEFQLDQTALEAVFDVPANNGEFTPQKNAYLQKLGRKRPSVFLAFPPKAAGTFLRQAIIEETGGDLIRAVHAQGGRDAQPYLPTFLAYYLGGICSGPLVAHAHMLGLPANICFVEAFGIRPIVMIRNIPDMLASYWDMLDHEDGALFEGLNCSIPECWPTMSRDRKADFLIDMLGQWYVKFYATWFEYAAKPRSQVLMLTYGDLLADPALVLEQILAHSGIPTSAEDCAEIIECVWLERSSLRFNRGREGRAEKYFSTRHMTRLERMLSYYPILTDRTAQLL